MYSIYILLCADKSLYTGITKDVARRFGEHRAGTASRYTRAHGARKIVYRETIGSRSDALKREAAIKKMSREEKLKMIRGAKGK